MVTGQQRARGLELDLTGRLTPAGSLTAAYTYLDTKMTRDNTLPVGSRLMDAARHSGGLFSKVKLTAWHLPAWSLGTGVVVSSNREVQLPNILIKLGRYTRLDAALYYDQAPWRMQLNVRNLTDRRIYTGQDGPDGRHAQCDGRGDLAQQAAGAAGQALNRSALEAALTGTRQRKVLRGFQGKRIHIR